MYLSAHDFRCQGSFLWKENLVGSEQPGILDRHDVVLGPHALCPGPVNRRYPIRTRRGAGPCRRTGRSPRVTAMALSVESASSTFPMAVRWIPDSDALSGLCQPAKAIPGSPISLSVSPSTLLPSATGVVAARADRQEGDQGFRFELPLPAPHLENLRYRLRSAAPG